jgi:hypothetical protein
MTQPEMPEWRDDGEPSKSISEFCLRENMSKATFRALAAKGLGPMIIRQGAFVRVVESHKSWRDRMLWHSQQQTALREQARRREQASAAGKIAAASPLHVSKRSHQ